LITFFEFSVSCCVFEGFWSAIPVLPALSALTVSFLFEKLQRCTRPAVGLHTYIHTLPLDNPRTYAGCLSVSSVPVSRKSFFKKRQSTSSLIEVILLRGFLDLVLVSVVTVFSLGLTSVSLFLYQDFLCFLSKGLRRVSESFLISLFSIVSDSLRSAVDLKSVFGLVLSSLFPFHLL
jgi:hypothetical protein